MFTLIEDSDDDKQKRAERERAVIEVTSATATKDHDHIPPVADVVTTLLPHSTAVSVFEEQLPRALITDIDSYRKGEQFLQALKRLTAAIANDQKDLIGPLKDFTRWVDARFKAVKDRLEVVDLAVRQRMLTFKQAEERRQQAEQARIRKEQEDRALEAASKARTPVEAEAILEAAADVPMTAAPAIRGMGTSTPKRWVGEAVNTKAICRAVADGHLDLDIVEFSQANLNAFAKRHGKEETVYGIKIEHKASMQVRG